MLEYKMPIELGINQQQEVQSLQQLDRLLSLENSPAKLMGANGEEIHIPESVYQVLRQVVHAMASGQAISVVPQERELTTQQAAEILNVSRPYLIKLLAQGEIPCIKVGTHRRIRFQDLMAYKQQRDTEITQLLDQLIQESQDLGFYE